MNRRSAATVAQCVDALEALIGLALVEATVRPFPYEIEEREKLHEPDLYIGGELKLAFTGGLVRFVSWDYAERGEFGYGVAVKDETHFRPGALEEWGTSDLPLWRAYHGVELNRVRVLGWSDVPIVLEFTFGEARLWLASGHETTLGDGDDLLIRCGPHRPDLDGFDLLWSTHGART